MTSLRLINPSKAYEASYRSLLEEFETRGGEDWFRFLLASLMKTFPNLSLD